jgi:hypothetical protein
MSVVDLSGHSTVAITNFHNSTAVVGEVNTYVFTADVSGAVIVYREIDTIEWDGSDNIVYKKVFIDGEPGPFGNEIDVEVVLINSEFPWSEDDTVMGQINALVNLIDSARAQGMGTITDYTALLNMANDISGTVNLNIDISGLQAVAAQAEAYGAIFETIQNTLEQVTTINDLTVLGNIKAELQKIADMYTQLGRLKLQIYRTSTLQIPNSISEMTTKLNQVYSNLDTTLNYLDYFNDPNSVAKPTNADINAQDAAAIAAATGALQMYSTLVQSQATVNPTGNTQVSNLTTAVNRFQNLINRLTSAKTTLDGLI